jgi:peptidoglycan/xylan/chitin deacetylase (PgdA/CDA1 family)
MKIVSPLLKNAVYPSMSKLGMFRRLPQQGLAVVTYHGVLPQGYQSIDPSLDGNLVPAESLRRQLRLLKARYQVVAPEDVRAWLRERKDLPARAVLLTCDDGLLNCLTDMLPVLKEEGVRCLFFVTGASAGGMRSRLWYEDLFLALRQAQAGDFEIGRGGLVLRGLLASREQRHSVWWDLVKRLSQVDIEARDGLLRAVYQQLGFNPGQNRSGENIPFGRRFDLLNASELAELVANGMTIGAHTMSHPMLSQASEDLAYHEIAQSRARLESILHQEVWAFAYPFGDPGSVTPQVLAMPQRAGYSAAFLNCGGGLGTGLPSYSLPRIHVTEGMSLGEFDAHVSGFYSWLQRRAGRNTQPDHATLASSG